MNILTTFEARYVLPALLGLLLVVAWAANRIYQVHLDCYKAVGR